MSLELVAKCKHFTLAAKGKVLNDITGKYAISNYECLECKQIFNAHDITWRVEDNAPNILYAIQD